jgi:putative addiction module component (TIGR02574 family)
MVMQLTREEILRLSVAERIELIEQIWDTIPDASADYPISEEQKEILAERLASYERDPSGTLTWEEVRKRAEAEN